MTAIDEHTTVLPSFGLNISTINTDTTTAGAIIDTQDFESLEYYILSSTIVLGTFTPLLEESDDSGMAGSNVIDSDFLLGTIANATFTLTDDDTVKRIGTVGKKRFVRLSLVSTGTADGVIGALAVLGHARTQPTTGS